MCHFLPFISTRIDTLLLSPHWTIVNSWLMQSKVRVHCVIDYADPRLCGWCHPVEFVSLTQRILIHLFINPFRYINSLNETRCPLIPHICIYHAKATVFYSNWFSVFVKNEPSHRFPLLFLPLPCSFFRRLTSICEHFCLDLLSSVWTLPCSCHFPLCPLISHLFRAFIHFPVGNTARFLAPQRDSDDGLWVYY